MPELANLARFRPTSQGELALIRQGSVLRGRCLWARGEA